MTSGKGSEPRRPFDRQATAAITMLSLAILSYPLYHGLGDVWLVALRFAKDLIGDLMVLTVPVSFWILIRSSGQGLDRRRYRVGMLLVASSFALYVLGPLLLLAINTSR